VTFHRPAPVNQFYRLEYDEVTDHYVKTTPWNDIVNGHDFDAENCMAAEGAVALDAHTNGRIRTSPAGIRNYQTDFSGGIGVDDVQDAWQRHFGQTLWTPRDFNWDDLLYAVRQRRHVAAAADYRKVPDAYKYQLPGNFDHALGIDAWRSSDGALLVFDSLSTGPRWQPQSSVRAAIEAIAIRERRDGGCKRPRITAARPLIGVSRFVVTLAGTSGKPTTYTPLYAGPGGIRVGAVSTATYICDRSKIDGIWWYQIVSKADGSTTANRGKWFKPNRYTTARPL